MTGVLIPPEIIKELLMPAGLCARQKPDPDYVIITAAPTQQEVWYPPPRNTRSMVVSKEQKHNRNKLFFHLDSNLSRVIQVGGGTQVYLWGWCFSIDHLIQNLEIIIDGQNFPVRKWAYPRWDVQNSLYPNFKKSHYDIIRSGFYTSFGLHEVRHPGKQVLSLRATLEGGVQIVEKLGSVELIQKKEYEPLDLHNFPLDFTQPTIAICMATYNPPIELFKRQIQSIREQTFHNWICLISDDCSDEYARLQIQNTLAGDSRFYFSSSPDRLGFYFNFERAFSRVPKQIQYVAPSDQDDYWHPDKLETLLSQMDNETNLVYSDMNIVDKDNHILQTTYWANRPNRYDNLTSLILANTITGAASLFRRELLDSALPFPQQIGDTFHDHWIGCVALATGKIKFVDRSLYDYVQHQGNVLGWFSRDNTIKMGLKGWLQFLKDPVYRAHYYNQSNSIYFYDYFRIQNIARVLLMRSESQISPEKQKAMRRIIQADQSIRIQLWLLARGWNISGKPSETIGAEHRILNGLFWKQYWGYKDQRVRRAHPSLETYSEKVFPEEAPPGDDLFPVSTTETGRLEEFERKISSLCLHITHSVEKRINLLIPTIDLNYVFGGYITKFNLARRLAEAGYRVRIVIVDYCDYQPQVWKEKFQNFQGLDNLLDQVEIAYVFDRKKRLVVHPEDVFIATTWWTAFIAHQAVQDLNKKRFIYLIQEYEPYTFPMGSYAALAEETYTFPHLAVFSTRLLRDFFKQNHYGVYGEGIECGEQDSMDFRNTITRVERVTRELLASRTRRKLLFYARPEPHASRNMYEMGVMALTRAIREGIFDKKWGFYGIGTVQGGSQFPLAAGKNLILMPRQSQEAYARTLRDYDLGLGLMFTPHPSLVPIEMASAGMVVVTNSFQNKTLEKMASISPNILTCTPTIDGIVNCIREAVGKVEDIDDRVKNSQVDWPTEWDQAFDTEFIEKLGNFIEKIRE